MNERKRLGDLTIPRNRINHEGDCKSSAFPGGSLFAALLNRRLMTMADLGDSSAMIGDRWAAIAAAHLQTLVEHKAPIPGASHDHIITTLARLDTEPGFSMSASKKGLRNPDALLLGDHQGTPTIQAVDAKFSIETARSSQVSTETVTKLMHLQPRIEAALRHQIPVGARPVSGFFVSPDSLFTRFVIRRGKGITKLQVSLDEVVFLPLNAREMFACLEGNNFAHVFSRIDRHAVNPDHDPAAGLYYFRLVRAAIGNWRETERPMLMSRNEVAFEADRFGRWLELATAQSRNAFQAVLQTSEMVSQLRMQRAAIERAASPPFRNGELREWVSADAAALGVESPSLNQVRRQIGSWYHKELRDRVGPVYPPIESLRQITGSIERQAETLRPLIRAQAAEAVARLAELNVQSTEADTITATAQFGGDTDLQKQCAHES